MSIEQNIKSILGEQTFAIAVLNAEIISLKEQIKELESKSKELESKNKSK